MADTTKGAGPKYVSVATLSLMTVAAVVSLRGLPMMAAEGLSMVFYILFATFIFLLPAAMVSAELGSMFYDKKGGVYDWVKAGMGTKWGFVAVWLQWIQNVVWYPTVLGFAAGCLAYLFKPAGGAAANTLANNGIYTGIVILVIYWISSLIALRGSTAVNKVTKWGVVLGTILPGILVIFFAILWIATGHAVEFLNNETFKQAAANHVHPVFFPHITGLGSISFLAGIVLLFAGVEVQAVQVMQMKDPRKQFPMAMLVASVIIFIIFLLGSLGVAIVVPVAQLTSGAGLTTGLLIAFQNMFEVFHMGWLVPVMGLLMAFGAIGGVMSWITGPSRSLLLTAQEGNLPPSMAKTNKYGSPVSLIIVQLVIVSLLACLYFIMKDVSIAFYILSAMTVTLYLGMYMLMFISAIRLRYTQPNATRAFKIGGGNWGMWIIAGIGFLGVLFAFIVGFFPPTSLTIGNNGLYVALVAAGLIIFVGAPLLMQKFKKPSWMPKVVASTPGSAAAASAAATAQTSTTADAAAPKAAPTAAPASKTAEPAQPASSSDASKQNSSQKTGDTK